MAEMPVLQGKGISMKFGEALVLDSVDVEFYLGKVYGVVGENGAGKSTLLKMITGVAFPTEGTITVNGRVSALLELSAGFDAQFTGAREHLPQRRHPGHDPPGDCPQV